MEIIRPTIVQALSIIVAFRFDLQNSCRRNVEKKNEYTAHGVGHKLLVGSWQDKMFRVI